MNSNVATLNLAAPPALSRAEPAQAMLRDWQRAGTVLSFVYARSLGGLMQTGHGRLTALSEAALTIDAGGSSLFVALANAKFDDSPQLFFTANYSANFLVPGVSIGLGNHDWLFFSAEHVPHGVMLARDGVPKLA
nr:hypothetical protein [uncultured Duganella sp.]